MEPPKDWRRNERAVNCTLQLVGGARTNKKR